MRRYLMIFSLVAMMLFIATASLAQKAGSPPSFEINWFTIDAGAGNSISTGGEYELSGTIGQHDAGIPMVGGTFELTGGFWPGAGIPCPGDTDNDGDVDVDDLGTVFVEWNSAGPAGDVDHDGDVDVDDLGIVFINWGLCS